METAKHYRLCIWRMKKEINTLPDELRPRIEHNRCSQASFSSKSNKTEDTTVVEISVTDPDPDSLDPYDSGFTDPDPLVRGTDSDPDSSIFKQK